MNHSDWFSSIDSSWINQAKIKKNPLSFSQRYSITEEDEIN